MVSTVALTFPGQGSQAIGMGQSLAQRYPAAAAVFEEVDEALGEPLSALIWNGPQSDLMLTANTQPALMAASLAAVRALEFEGVDLTGVAYVAGHSLGEYSALAAAGALSITDAARLLRLRGEAMQDAVAPGVGAMAALLGLDGQAASEVAQEAAADDVCEIANDNAPGQIVVSGHRAAVERAIALARSRGARPMLLPVSAPFHCSLMGPAADRMRDALASVALAPPVVPVVSNVLAEPIADPDAIREALLAQVTGRVRWRETVEWLVADGVRTHIELGAGRVLSGLARRIDRKIDVRTLNSADDVAAVVDLLRSAQAA